MAQKISKTPSINSRFAKTFRISAFHNIMFKQMPGSDYPGLLVRMLLDDYFNHKFPDLEKRFLAECKIIKERQLKILENHKMNSLGRKKA